MHKVSTVKVERIDAFFLRYPFPPEIRYVYSGGKVDNMDVAVIRITAEDGRYGIGEVTHGQFTYEPIVGLVRHFARLLQGTPVADINRAWERMYQSSIFWNRQGLGIGVMGGIDIALHDLLGKLMGLPVHRLLGGPVRERVRIYASNGLFDAPEALLADARRARAMGFDAYKMRVVTLETVEPLVAAFRGEFGRDMDLIVDAVQGSCAVPWSVRRSRDLARALEPHGILWFEEPVRVENIDGYVELRGSTGVNIAGAESIPTALAFRPYLERDAFDIVQFDIATAGFTEGRRIAALAGVYHKPVALHSWGSIISIMAGVHFAAVTPNCAATEYCFMDHPLNEALAVQPLRPVDGHVPPPELPGLGVRFDETLAETYPYEAGINTMISIEEKDLLL